jgi:hypothetical protein
MKLHTTLDKVNAQASRPTTRMLILTMRFQVLRGVLFFRLARSHQAYCLP